jgi:hypothetical protein
LLVAEAVLDKAEALVLEVIAVQLLENHQAVVHQLNLFSNLTYLLTTQLQSVLVARELTQQIHAA